MSSQACRRIKSQQRTRSQLSTPRPPRPSFSPCGSPEGSSRRENLWKVSTWERAFITANWERARRAVSLGLGPVVGTNTCVSSAMSLARLLSNAARNHCTEQRPGQLAQLGIKTASEHECSSHGLCQQRQHRLPAAARCPRHARLLRPRQPAELPQQVTVHHTRVREWLAKPAGAVQALRHAGVLHPARRGGRRGQDSGGEDSGVRAIQPAGALFQARRCRNAHMPRPCSSGCRLLLCLLCCAAAAAAPARHCRLCCRRAPAHRKAAGLSPAVCRTAVVSSRCTASSTPAASARSSGAAAPVRADTAQQA